MTYDFKMIVFIDFFCEAEKANHQGCVQAYLLTEKNLSQLVFFNIC